MNQDDAKFTPEQVEQQIDRLALLPNSRPVPSSDMHLIAELYQIYDEDDQIAKGAWQRLAERVKGTNQRPFAGDVILPSRSHTDPMDMWPERQKEPHTMHIETTKKRSSNAFFRLMELCAALLLAAALVAGTALILQSAHQKTPGPTGSVSSPSGLYVKTLNGVMREDLASGKILWQYPLSQKLESEFPVNVAVYVVDGVTIFQVNTASNLIGSLVGLNASTGKQLWKQETISGALGAAGDGVAIVLSVITNSSGSQYLGISAVTAYQATTGQKLWSYKLPQPANSKVPPASSYALVHGVYYIIYGSERFALDASTGTLLWKKNLPTGFSTGLWSFTISTPVMSGDLLYFIDSKMGDNGNSQTWLFAINTRTGNESWHQIFDFNPKMFAPTVVDGTVYVAGRGIKDGGLPHIYTYDALHGTFLHTYTLSSEDGFNFPLLHVGDLLLYSRGNGSVANGRYRNDLVAFSLTTKTVAWQVPVGTLHQISTPQIAHNIIYVPSDDHLLAYTTSGKLVHTYDAVPIPPATSGAADPSSYWGFVVVA